MTPEMTDDVATTHYLDERLRDLQERISRQIATQERERGESINTLDRRLSDQEKYALTLVDNLQRQATSGDEALLQHIRDQVEQIRLAIDAVRRESDLQREASDKAIEKSEVALSRRLDLLNEFRSQSADEQKKFLPREVYETSVTEWTGWRNKVDQQMWEGQGRASGLRMSAGALTGIITAATAIIIAAIAIANVLASG